MKFKKEDIEKVYKTNAIENSLLVLQASGNSSNYIEYAGVFIKNEKLELKQIKNWINQIPRFRDSYIYENDTPVRIRFKKSQFPVEVLNSNNFKNLESFIKFIEENKVEFNVQQPPLFKIFITYIGQSTLIGLAYHHLLFDGISIQLAFGKLNPLNKIKFNDWLPTFKSNTENQKKKYQPFLLKDFLPGPDNNSFGYYRKEVFFNKSYQDLMLAWVKFIKQASGRNDLIIGEVLSARDSSINSNSALGYYIQTWPLLFDDVSIDSWQENRNNIIAISADSVNNYFTPNLFDHCWVVEPTTSYEHQTIFRSTPHYILSINFIPQKNGTKMSFCWNLSKTNIATARQIIQSFSLFKSSKENILKKVKSNLINKLPFNTILDMWDKSVVQNPNNIAVHDQFGNELTFSDLDKRANELSKKISIESSVNIGIHTSFSSNIVLSMLAILKAKGVYVPLDPSVSKERINYILSDADIKVIVTDLSTNFTKQIQKIHPNSVDDNKIVLNPERKMNLNDTVYLIYTSGTTGTPKGCAINHKNLINLFTGTQKIFKFSNEDHWVLAHSYGFDFSTWEIWGSLLNGSKLFIPKRDLVKDTFRFHSYIKENRISILNQTPKSFYNLALVDQNYILSDLRYVIFGGDKLNNDRIKKWQKKYIKVNLVNMYGITETTVHVTYKLIKNEFFSNIGIPLPGYNISINNSKGTSVPKGFLGEIYINGQGVCNGYYNKKKLTNEKFILKGACYKSGDIGWQNEDDFYYLGRVDRQIKIRGFRIELGEIEHNLKKKYPSLDFVVLFTSERLICFFTGNLSVIKPEYLKDFMTDYSIPSWFKKIKKFPLNQSGKIDEKKLLSLYSNSLNDSSHKKNTVHPILKDVIIQILGGSVNFDKTFIQNGGDSISAIRIINLLRKKEYTISVKELFETLPLEELKLLPVSQKQRRNPIVEYSKIIDSNQKDDIIFPLLEAQQGILYDCLKTNDSSIYVEFLTYEIKSSYSVKEIKNAYFEVCKNHPILLSKIVKINNEYVFKVEKKNNIKFHEEKETNLEELLIKLNEKGIHYMDSLSNLYIIPGTENHKICWVHHHLILDGWSLGVFSKLMSAALNGEKIKYSDSFLKFSCQNFLEKSSSNYWSKYENINFKEPFIPFLPDRLNSSENQKFSIDLNINYSEKLKELNISDHVFTLSAWSSFISLLFNRKDSYIGNVVSLRDSSGFDKMGMYVRTLPFHLLFDEKDSFVSYMLKTFTKIQKDHDHKNEPLNSYINASLINHLFVFENYPIDKVLLDNEGIKVLEYKEKTGADWTTLVYPKENGYQFDILYNSSVYAHSYVSNILTHFKKWIINVDWDMPLSRSTLLFEKEKIDGFDNFNYNQYNSVLDILKFDSEKIAIISSISKISYRALKEKFVSLSNSLISKGLKRGEAVGVDVQSTTDFTISILAIWEAGGVVCPVDKRYPINRKEFIYEKSFVRWILVNNNNKIIIKKSSFDAINLMDSKSSFILFTSGSTGEPKGVIQTHNCLINLILWNKNNFKLSKDDKILQLSSFGFDASFHEILLSISLSASLVEIPIENRVDIHLIKKHIINFKVTLAWIPARLLNAVLDSDPYFFDDCEVLKNIVTTGEALLLTEKLMTLLKRKNISLLNFYGPTETHVVTSNQVSSKFLINTPSIGRAIPNCEILLQNSSGSESFKGLPGEILVSGPCNALGYLNNDMQTRELFIKINEKNWYKTGDWAFRDQDGSFHYLGRKDNQIKIRGFRVEPLEIERVILKNPSISQCSVLVRDDQIVVFFVGSKSDDEIKKYCRKYLPDYMVPNIAIPILKIPLNQNSKTDRKALYEIFENFNSKKTIINLKNSNAAKCWYKVLGHNNFHENTYFETVGGNSILLMKMQAWLERNQNIYVSVSELLHHNTVSMLENLIHQKNSEELQNLPKSFSLNFLQKDMLISLLGNNNEFNSPFLLEFKVVLKINLSEKLWKNSINNLLELFPQLQYTIQNYNDVENSYWSKFEDMTSFYKSFEASSSLSNPLIRFVYLNTKTIVIQWHHILLDGLSMAVVINRLIDIIEGKYLKTSFSFNSFLNFQLKNPKINVVSLNENVSFNLFNFSYDNMAIFNRISIESGVPISTICYYTVSLACNCNTIAVASVENHPGIPGMFTELRSVTFNKNCNKLKDIVMSSGIDNSLNHNVIVNFMEVNYNLELVDNLESKHIEKTKYPYEWQFVNTNGTLDVMFLSSVNDSIADKIFEDWKSIIKKLINGEFPNKKIEKFNDIFDDFDF